MSANDREIINRLKAAFKECVGVYSGEVLQDKMIAKATGVAPTTLNSGLSNIGNFFDDKRISNLYNGLKNSDEKCIKILAPVLMEILEYQDEKIRIEKKKFRSDLSMSKVSAEPVTFFLSTQSDLAAYLPGLFDPNSFIKKLNFIVNKDSIAHDVVLIEQWAYSREGNYSDQLYLNLYERDYEPIAEMVGAFIEGEFRAYMYDEGYKLMSKIGHELLLEEEQRLSDEQPVWSLPRSPEARFIERLRRELKDYFDSVDSGLKLPAELLEEVLDFLADKAAAYDAVEPAIQEGHPFNWLHDAIASELRDRYKDEEKYTVDEVTKVADLVKAACQYIRLQDA